MEQPAVSFGSDAEDYLTDAGLVNLEDSELAESLKENNVENLKTGKVYTNRPDKIITILVVGETGTGKTSFISWLANSVAGNLPDCYKSFVDLSKEAGGSKTESQTNSSTLYEFPSSNGIILRLLDTPGLADTRGIDADTAHKRNIADTIAEHVATVDAVLILVNGSSQRLAVATEYALNTLTFIFPRSLINNIGFLFTNVANKYSLNFSSDGLPQALRNNRRFTLDNPFAIDQKRIEYSDNSEEALELVLQAHKKSLVTLAMIIDWINTLEPCPTTDILVLRDQCDKIEKLLVNRLSFIGQLADRKKELSGLHSGTQQDHETILKKDVYQLVHGEGSYSVCTMPDCYSNCHNSKSWFVPRIISIAWSTYTWNIRRRSCRTCGHSIEGHRWWDKKWELVKFEDTVTDVIREKEKSIMDLGKLISDASARIEDLMESYAKLSLSGSFVVQVQKSLAFMEAHLESLQSKKSELKHIEAVKRGVDDMKKRLQAIEDAQQKKSGWRSWIRGVE